MSNPYFDASTPPTSPPPGRRAAPAWKKVLAWTGVVLGALVLISQITNGSPLAGLLIGGAMILPGAWWLLHERREAKGAAPMPRHWVPVTLAAIVMLFAGGAAAPTPPKTEDPKPAATTPSTSTAPSTIVAPTTTKTTPPITTQPMSTSPSSEPSTATPPPVSESAPERNTPAPAPFIAPVPEEPSPSYAPPAPAYDSPSTGGDVVHPGSYCSGGTGVTKKGTPMVCAPGSDGKMRWQSAS